MGSDVREHIAGKVETLSVLLEEISELADFDYSLNYPPKTLEKALKNLDDALRMLAFACARLKEAHKQTTNGEG